MCLPLFMTGAVIYSYKRIGGMAFSLLVLRPSMIAIDQNQRPVLGTTVLKRFIIFARLSIVVLILTGGQRRTQRRV